MARKDYQERLTELRENVLYMSEVVAERLRMGLDALDRQDGDLGQEIIDRDSEINQLYLDLEQDCINLLALQQPVAGDLRFITASFKIITDLERIADLATNLGGYAQEAEREVFPDVDIQRIGDETLAMLEMAMEAYAEDDADACYDVSNHDDEVDEMCAQASELVVRDLLESEALEPGTTTQDEAPEPANEAEVETLMQDVSRLLLTIRDLERVGDHAVNIAARTLYMVENSDELIY